MARKEPSKEATLKEVLAEVSLADVGGMLKGWLKTVGCLGIFFGFAFLVGPATEAAGLKLPDWGIPSWLWLLIVPWGVVYAATAETSYHEISWYFPKQGWFGSLLLAAYAVGFIYLVIQVYNMEKGDGAFLAFLAVWFGYTGPFTAFTAVTTFGHAKLMEKRRREMDAANGS